MLGHWQALHAGENCMCWGWSLASLQMLHMVGISKLNFTTVYHSWIWGFIWIWAHRFISELARLLSKCTQYNMTQSHKLFVLKCTHRALRVGAGGVMGGGTPRCYQLGEMDSHLPPGGPSNPTSNHKNSHTFVNSVTVYIDCSFTPAIWSRPVQTKITLVCYF